MPGTGRQPAHNDGLQLLEQALGGDVARLRVLLRHAAQQLPQRVVGDRRAGGIGSGDSCLKMTPPRGALDYALAGQALQEDEPPGVEVRARRGGCPRSCSGAA